MSAELVREMKCRISSLALAAPYCRGRRVTHQQGQKHSSTLLGVTSNTRTSKWDRATDIPLMLASFAFLIAYAVPIIWPDISPATRAVCDVTTWSVWGFFVVDYVTRLLLADNRLLYVKGHLLDLAVIALPLLRPLRLLRLVTMLRFLDNRATMKLRGRMMIYVLGGSALLGFVGALAVLDAERRVPGANIGTFEEACWWAVTTMTTVGYGDFYPVTGTGRLAAVGLMIGGIAILGTVTASLASWMVERIREDEESSPASQRISPEAG